MILPPQCQKILRPLYRSTDRKNFTANRPNSYQSVRGAYYIYLPRLLTPSSPTPQRAPAPSGLSPVHASQQPVCTTLSHRLSTARDPSRRASQPPFPPALAGWLYPFIQILTTQSLLGADREYIGYGNSCQKKRSDDFGGQMPR